MKVLVDFKPELDYAENKDKIIAHIQCTLTDRASMNYAGQGIGGSELLHSFTRYYCQ